jgi:hypothetical protein
MAARTARTARIFPICKGRKTCMSIEKPGMFNDMPAADYHADPCPSPSLSASIAKVLIDYSPAHAKHAHPRLNPNYKPSESTRFDLGSVCHAILLGRGKEIEVVIADDWRTKIAKEAREKAREAGKLPVLAEHYEKAVAMATIAGREIASLGIDLEAGNSEPVLAWREGDIWFRTMIDWLSSGANLVIDLKTTGESAAPHNVPAKMASDGWAVQAAMHERALNVFSPATMGRRKHLFILIETDEPHALTVNAISEGVMTMGRKQLAYAVAQWDKCMRENIWPGYPRLVNTPELPSWAENRWLDREIKEETRQATDKVMGKVASLVDALRA